MILPTDSCPCKAANGQEDSKQDPLENGTWGYQEEEGRAESNNEAQEGYGEEATSQTKAVGFSSQHDGG